MRERMSNTIKFIAFACLLQFTVTSCNEKKQIQQETEIILSEEIALADPFILYHDDMYYAYGTSPNNSDGFEVYYSKTLDKWQKHPQLLLDQKDSYGDKWFWAPEVYYNAANKKFYLYYSAEEHICVATSDSPLGPFVQEKKEPMREEKSIDSSLFVDEDGTPYIFFVRFTKGNVIWAAELEKDWMTIKEETLVQCIEVSATWEMAMATVAEGPSVIKKNNTYYLLYSANHYESPNYGVGYATAESPLGKWTKSDKNPILQNPKQELKGAGHGAYFVDRDKNEKYVFHSHFNDSTIHPRLMYIVDMTINSNGAMMNEATIIKPYNVK